MHVVIGRKHGSQRKMMCNGAPTANAGVEEMKGWDARSVNHSPSVLVWDLGTNPLSSLHLVFNTGT